MMPGMARIVTPMRAGLHGGLASSLGRSISLMVMMAVFLAMPQASSAGMISSPGLPVWLVDGQGTKILGSPAVLQATLLKEGLARGRRGGWGDVTSPGEIFQPDGTQATIIIDGRGWWRQDYRPARLIPAQFSPTGESKPQRGQQPLQQHPAQPFPAVHLTGAAVPVSPSFRAIEEGLTLLIDSSGAYWSSNDHWRPLTVPAGNPASSTPPSGPTSGPALVDEMLLAESPSGGGQPIRPAGAQIRPVGGAADAPAASADGLKDVKKTAHTLAGAEPTSPQAQARGEIRVELLQEAQPLLDLVRRVKARAPQIDPGIDLDIAAVAGGPEGKGREEGPRSGSLERTRHASPAAARSMPDHLVVRFAPGSAALDQQARQDLQAALAGFGHQVQEGAVAYPLLVIRPGSAEAGPDARLPDARVPEMTPNTRLDLNRAREVRRFLLRQGLRSQIDVEDDLTGELPRDQDQSRRVTIIIAGRAPP